MSEEAVRNRLKAKVWLTSQEASELMSEIHGRTISPAYVRLLGRQGLIKTQPLDKRTTLFSKNGCENYHVAEHPAKKAGRQGPGRPRKAQQENAETQSEGDDLAIAM